jgi:predicted RNA methylase
MENYLLKYEKYIKNYESMRYKIYETELEKNKEYKIDSEKYLREKERFFENTKNNFLFIPTEYLNMPEILSLLNLKFKTLTKNLKLSEKKIIPINIKDDIVYYGEKNVIFVPLINTKPDYDLTYVFYDLFDNVPSLISNRTKNVNYLSLQVFGPEEIKDKKINIPTDIFGVIEKYRKNKLLYVNNDYDLLIKPIYFGEKLEWDGIKYVNDINFKVNVSIGDFFNREVLNELLNNNKKYFLIESRAKVYVNYKDILNIKMNKIYLLYELYIIMKKLEQNGCLLFPMRIFHNELVEILYLYSKLFNYFEIYYSGIRDSYYCILFDFKGEDKKYSDYLKKNIIDKMNDIMAKEKVEKNFEPNKFQGELDFDDLIDNNEMKLFKKKIAYTTEIFLCKDELRNDIVDLGIKIYNDLDKNGKEYFLKRLKDINISFSLNFVKKYNWEINSYYTTEGTNKKEIMMANMDDFKFSFPSKLEINGKIVKPDLNKVKYSLESLYSFTPYNEAEQTVYLIAEFLKINVKDLKELVITDGTTNVGGNMIAFCKYFKFVNGVEIESTHVDYLKNNLELYGLKNYSIINGDYTKEYDKLEQDIVFLDPPWGGVLYKYYDRIDLYLSGIDISEIINKIKTKHIILKVPKNYNTLNLQLNVDFNYAIIYKLRRYLLIMIKK